MDGNQVIGPTDTDRPAMGGKGSGNRTARRGRKLVRSVRLTDEAAGALRAVLAFRQIRFPHLTEGTLVSRLIEREWNDIDQSIQAAAISAAEGEATQ